MAKSDKDKTKSGKKDKPLKAKSAASPKAAKSKNAKKPTKTSAASVAGQAAKGIQSLSQNPLIADVVAAALVSMAAALKDSKKAHQLAEGAGEQLTALSKNAAKEGNVMWDLAREVGRKTLDAIVSEQGGKGAKARKSGKSNKAG